MVVPLWFSISLTQSTQTFRFYNPTDNQSQTRDIFQYWEKLLKIYERSQVSTLINALYFSPVEAKGRRLHTQRRHQSLQTRSGATARDKEIITRAMWGVWRPSWRRAWVDRSVVSFFFQMSDDRVERHSFIEEDWRGGGHQVKKSTTTHIWVNWMLLLNPKTKQIMIMTTTTVMMTAAINLALGTLMKFINQAHVTITCCWTHSISDQKQVISRESSVDVFSKKQGLVSCPC